MSNNEKQVRAEIKTLIKKNAEVILNNGKYKIYKYKDTLIEQYKGKGWRMTNSNIDLFATSLYKAVEYLEHPERFEVVKGS